MQPLFVNLSGYLQLILIPDNEFDCHGRVLDDLSYSIYLDTTCTINTLMEKEIQRNLGAAPDPDYLGRIVMSAPHVFYYYASYCERSFNIYEIEEIAERIIQFNLYKAWAHR
ncbi:hypothetical protein SAMN05216464_103493 [Mucilaginibacter pineti]|uniref:Uncharacterized protein n=1 Tax=Mucilaginibacter pineti TaxID=1391627 RepID=A0A1G6ZTU1_9SPHI|nr:hypothetical protein [Mucilaginibacter pineti]SDE05969.1 hypothetical protein SAMN05216464_103493 [Mucilaginibacter pineti]